MEFYNGILFHSKKKIGAFSFLSQPTISLKDFFYVECLSKLRLNSITNEIYIYSITEQKSIKQVTDFSSNQLEIQLGILRLFNRDSITAQSLQRN